MRKWMRENGPFAALVLIAPFVGIVIGIRRESIGIGIFATVLMFIIEDIGLTLSTHMARAATRLVLKLKEWYARRRILRAFVMLAGATLGLLAEVLLAPEESAAEIGIVAREVRMAFRRLCRILRRTRHKIVTPR